MGIHEKADALREDALKAGASNVSRVRVTRTIVIEGKLDWVAATIGRCYVADLGDYQTTLHGKVSCTDRRVEVLD